MRVFSALIVVVFCKLVAEAAILERFDAGWESRWMKSVRPRELSGRTENLPSTGFAMLDDLRWYRFSTTPQPQPFNNRGGKALVVQLAMTWRKPLGCGGVMVVLAPQKDAKGKEIRQETWAAKEGYSVKFGPDLCGMAVHHIVANLVHNGNITTGPKIESPEDDHPHAYTLVLRPDNSYSIKIDNAVVSSGRLEDEWELLGPKMVRNVAQPRPKNWDSRQMVADPAWVKPKGKPPPKQIPDPDARKPRGWDTKRLGKWKRPLMDNPEYHEHWVAPLIPNKDYMGDWVPDLVPNPEIVGKSDPLLYTLAGDVWTVGLEAWVENAGVQVHHVLLSHSEQEAETLAQEFLSGHKPQSHEEL